MNKIIKYKIKKFFRELILIILAFILAIGFVLIAGFPIVISVIKDNYWLLFLYFVVPIVGMLYFWFVAFFASIIDEW